MTKQLEVEQQRRVFLAELAAWGPSAGSGRGFSPAEATRYCQSLTRRHYENFTVASWLLPRPLRPHFAHIYAYCRWSDDLADEVGDPAESVRVLEWWRGELERCFSGEARHPVFVALRETIRRFDLPKAPFERLLDAFLLDQSKSRYDTMAELEAYCTCSANPVGELLLRMAESYGEETAVLSDSICTGLQLINHWQDLRGDFRDRERIYLPRELWGPAGITEADFAADRASEPLRRGLRPLVADAERRLREGRPLVDRVPAWLAFEVELFVGGGLAIAAEIKRADFDVLHRRPKVGRLRKLGLIWAAWRRKR